MINKIMERLGNGYIVTRERVPKNNGVVRDCFVIREVRKAVGVCIPFNPSDDETTIVDRVCKSFLMGAENMDAIEGKLDNITDKGFILKNVRPVLINTKANTDLLSKAVNLPFLDMSMVYRVFLSEDMSFIVTSSLVGAVNVSGIELYEAAMSNLAQMVVVRKMSELASFPTMCDEFMLVVNTKDSMYGASVMVLPGLLEQIGKVFDSDYYIIPSSIHEIICVPANLEMDPGIIVDMIKVVNIEEVAPGDVLSDSLYKWSKKKGVEVVR